MTTTQNLYRQLFDSLLEPDHQERKAVATYLLAEKYGINSIDLLLDRPTFSLDLESDIGRLNSGEPVQYVVGKVHFANHLFFCGPGALIPRPETEELIYSLQDRGPFHSILDIGTGTGCIAHSLALAFPQAYVEAWDISEEAIYWAEKNKEHLQTQVEIKQFDIFEVQKSDTPIWDLIVSNPPYIIPSEKSQMLPRVYDFEPNQALFVPENDPLLFYKAITQWASTSLRRGGLLAFEINQAYGKEVVYLVEENGFSDIELLRDIPGKDRMVLGRR